MSDTVKETKVRKPRKAMGPMVRYVKLTVTDVDGNTIDGAKVRVDEILTDAKTAFARKGEGFVEVGFPRS